ncbi:MAG TPA: alpha/beta hydrolase [Trueperaceae bacterium]|nr:alpha/beta hydrolase [Trueperaceae bacterium]
MTTRADEPDDQKTDAWREPSLDETYLIERFASRPAADPGTEGSDVPAGVAGSLDDQDVSEVELYVERVGRPGARTVYYLHGGPGYNSYSFRELVGDDLADYDVIYADQRGGGRSYGAATVSVTTLAEDVLAVLDGLGVGSATLLAHGFGAAIAVRTAVLRPERIDRVVLVNPWLSMPLLAQAMNDEARNLASGTLRSQRDAEEDGEEDADGPDVDAAPTSDPQSLVDEAFGIVNPKVLFDAMEFPTASGRLHLEHVDAVALTGDMSDEVPAGVWSIDELASLERLDAVSVPVVVVSGNHDLTSYPVQAEQALLRSPSALFSLLDTGHYPWIDDPDTFAEVLRAALGDDAG